MLPSRWAIGLDVSKDDFVARIFLVDQKGRPHRRRKRKFSNNATGHTGFYQWLEKHAPQPTPRRVAMEATGVYHERLAYFLHDQGCATSIVLPNLVKAFGRSLNQFSKTDPIDADIIARLNGERELAEWQPANAHMRRLKTLSRERQTLLQEQTSWLNRRHAHEHSAQPCPSTRRRMEQQLKLIKRQLQQVEKEMERLTKRDEQLAGSVRVMSSIKGVGATTALTILAETDGLQLFKNRAQLIKYAGLDVVEKQSGSSIHGQARISKRGNNRLRGALFMPALTAIRYPGVFRDVYLRQLERQGCKPKALMAVQRKLLMVLFALHRKDQEYEEQIHRQRLEKEVGNHVDCLQ